jgi:hypothetical protein
MRAIEMTTRRNVLLWQRLVALRLQVSVSVIIYRSLVVQRGTPISGTLRFSYQKRSMGLRQADLSASLALHRAGCVAELLALLSLVVRGHAEDGRYLEESSFSQER